MIRKYQNLKVWEKATELTLQVYAITYHAVLNISAENGKMLNGLISKLEGSSSGDRRLATGD
jgi:hypothetical protein